MKKDRFWSDWDKWMESALIEYNERFGCNVRLYDPENEDDDDGILGVEFSASGDAYPHNRCGIGHIRQAVTPYEEEIDDDD